MGKDFKILYSEVPCNEGGRLDTSQGEVVGLYNIEGQRIHILRTPWHSTLFECIAHPSKGLQHQLAAVIAHEKELGLC